MDSVSKTVSRGAICSLFVVLFPTPVSNAEKIVYEEKILPLVSQYCGKCHNEDRLKGDVDLMRFENQAQAVEAIAIWQRAARRVQNNEMPPGGRKKLDDDEKKLFAEWVKQLDVDFEDCRQIESEASTQWYRGDVMSRRLNRAEYENTLRDLLGIDVAVEGLFPADGAGGEGFDTAGAALFLSAIQMEKYLEAADLAIEEALPTRPHKPGGKIRRALGRFVTLRWKKDEHEQELARIRDTLIATYPDGDVSDRTAARTVVESFMERAWRRPVTEEELARFVDLFESRLDTDDGYEEAIKLAMKAVLVSPNFIFLAEPQHPDVGNHSLGDFPLAARLSYFLWASMPDDTLFALARDGKLQDEAVLEEQALRMLADPKARALGDRFAAQWLGISQLGETKRPDGERFPEFNDAVATAMREEPAVFFQRLVAEDRSLIELIDADYTYMNAALAAIYGEIGIDGDAMRKVALSDPRRGGVMAMPAVLTSTSHALRTSPVLRGKWVLETLLGDRVPPPPPDAGTLPEDDRIDDGLTFRERMVQHRRDPNCAACHQRMDPIGFGLEQFDPIGRWRDTQAGEPIDASGELPSGEAFNGPDQLKEVLLKRKDKFVRNLTRKLYGYAMGRGLNRYDKCVIDDCVAALKANDYRASHLFTEIVLSYPFRHRYSSGTAEPEVEPTDT